MTEPAPSPVKTWTTYARWDRNDSCDAIVVGSGMGSLVTAAILAKQAGKRVLILERHYVPGGFTHVFRRSGYEWDVGLHYVGQMDPQSSMRQQLDYLTDGQVDWTSMGRIYDEMRFDDERYPFAAGDVPFRTQLAEHFPRDAVAIDRFAALCSQCAGRARHYFTYKSLPSFLQFVSRRWLTRPFLKLASRTTRSVLEEITPNARLAGVLAGQWGDFGLPPGQSSFAMTALVADHYRGGAYYPVGGSEVLASQLLKPVIQAGGELLVRAEVEAIELERGRAVGVRMKDGRVLRAKWIISGAGAFNTVERLWKPATEADHSYPVKEWPQIVGNVTASTAHVSLYVGIRQTAEELGLPQHNIWVFPFDDHDHNVRTYWSNTDAPFPFVYISFPSAKDPTFTKRFPGRATIQAMAPAPYDQFGAWREQPWHRRGDDYEQYKADFAARLQRVLEEQVPQVRGKIDFAEASTPVTTDHFANTTRGEIYGLEHSPQRFGYLSLAPRTQVKGLYLTGQDVATCGIVGAMGGGIMCASAILGRNVSAGIARARR